MEKAYRRNEIVQKKNEGKTRNQPMVKPADVNSRIKEHETVKVRINPDGDTRKISGAERTYVRNQRANKPSIYATVRRPVNMEAQQYSEGLKELLNKRHLIRNVIAKPSVELKRIREKYTAKLGYTTRTTSPANRGHTQIDNVRNGLKHVFKEPLQTKAFNENVKNGNKEPPHVKEKAPDMVQKTCTLANAACKTTEKASQLLKKPVIRTITTKNGSTKIYKAVAFKEQKEIRPPLQINIPIEFKASVRPDDSFKLSNSTKSTDFNSSKSKPTISIDNKSVLARKCSRRRVKRHKRPLLSKESSAQDIKKCRSPSTEVAKWAPASVTSHTKPYYEAWVDTTLTAVSKHEKMKLEKNVNDERLKNTLNPTDTPELFYTKYADERFRGKIKITQR